MMDYLNEEQAAFFKWCDDTARAYTSREGVTLSQWRPRKNPDGSYDLVLKLTHPGGTSSKQVVAVPGQFHELLEKEYFIYHAGHEDEL